MGMSIYWEMCLQVSPEEAQTLGQDEEQRLLRDRKLVLLVDLDQTLIHTTNDIIPPHVKDVFHYKLGANPSWYVSRKKIKNLYLNSISE